MGNIRGKINKYHKVIHGLIMLLGTLILTIVVIIMSAVCQVLIGANHIKKNKMIRLQNSLTLISDPV